MNNDDDAGIARVVALRLKEGISEAKGRGLPVALDYMFAEKLAELLERLADAKDPGTW